MVRIEKTLGWWYDLPGWSRSQIKRIRSDGSMVSGMNGNVSSMKRNVMVVSVCILSRSNGVVGPKLSKGSFGKSFDGIREYVHSVVISPCCFLVQRKKNNCKFWNIRMLDSDVQKFNSYSL